MVKINIVALITQNVGVFFFFVCSHVCIKSSAINVSVDVHLAVSGYPFTVSQSSSRI